MKSEFFIPGSENHNLRPVNINKAEDDTHYWHWDSNHKGYFRGGIKPGVKVLVKNLTYWEGREPKWKEAVVIKPLSGSIHQLKITDPLADDYNQMDFASESLIKIRANQ